MADLTVSTAERSSRSRLMGFHFTLADLAACGLPSLVDRSVPGEHLVGLSPTMLASRRRPRITTNPRLAVEHRQGVRPVKICSACAHHGECRAQNVIWRHGRTRSDTVSAQMPGFRPWRSNAGAANDHTERTHARLSRTNPAVSGIVVIRSQRWSEGDMICRPVFPPLSIVFRLVDHHRQPDRSKDLLALVPLIQRKALASTHGASRLLVSWVPCRPPGWRFAVNWREQSSPVAVSWWFSIVGRR